MAFDANNFALITHANGFKEYRYDTMDTLATVDTSGYFNNADDDLILAVGDKVNIYVWATAVRTGTIADVGSGVVASVDAAGVVDLTDDLLLTTLADTD